MPYADRNAQLYLFASLNVAGGSDVVTVHSSGTYALLYLHQFSNLVSIESAKGQEGTGLYYVMDSGGLSTMGSNHLIFGFGISSAVSAGPEFTTTSNADSNITEFRIAEAPDVYHATASNVSAMETRWTMLGAAFKGR